MARTLVAPSITWLLVSTRPEEEMIIPVPSAVSPLNVRFDVMSTRPGSTFFCTVLRVERRRGGSAARRVIVRSGDVAGGNPGRRGRAMRAERYGRPGADARRERGDGHVDQQPPAPARNAAGGGSGAGQPGAPPPDPRSRPGPVTAAGSRNRRPGSRNRPGFRSRPGSGPGSRGGPWTASRKRWCPGSRSPTRESRPGRASASPRPRRGSRRADLPGCQARAAATSRLRHRSRCLASSSPSTRPGYVADQAGPELLQRQLPSS